MCGALYGMLGRVSSAPAEAGRHFEDVLQELPAGGMGPEASKPLHNAYDKAGPRRYLAGHWGHLTLLCRTPLAGLEIVGPPLGFDLQVLEVRFGQAQGKQVFLWLAFRTPFEDARRVSRGGRRPKSG